MPNTAQAKKRLRQDENRNLRNRMAKSQIKTLTKKLLAAVAAGDKETATSCLRETQVCLDKAAKGNVFHRNTVARRKSLLARQVSGM